MNPDPLPHSIFENTEIAYSYKSDSELKKAFYLFKMMNNPFLVKLGNKAINLMLKLHFPIYGIIRNTIYEQFCGGESLEKSLKVIKNLEKHQIETLLNYSVEGLEDAKSYLFTFEKTLEAIQFAKENQSIRAVCIKFTGFAKIDIWIKLQKGETLNEAERSEYEQAKYYIDTLCQEAVKSSVQLYVDAEESWFQDSIDALADKMMLKYNQQEAIVFNTYQMYRNDKLAYLQKSIETAKENGYILGAKLVRGAYVEKENEYASQHGIPSPIHKSKEATDIDFDKGIAFCIENIENVSICCASHNEKSNLLFLEGLKNKGIPLNHKHVCSSQLFGMSDNITYNMGNEGIKMAKYLPFGPIKEVIPYLIRRSQENTSMEGQSSREFTLLNKEVQRRGL